MAKNLPKLILDTKPSQKIYQARLKRNLKEQKLIPGHIDEGAKGKLRTKHKLTAHTPLPPPSLWDMCDIPLAFLAAQQERRGKTNG